jgi:amino acid adenylation domain-containing protein
MGAQDTSDATGLSAERLELLAYLLEEEGIELPPKRVISRRENLDKYPLSFAQQRLWFLDQLEPDSVVYNIPTAFRLTGLLDVAALEKSLNNIVQRHEALRTIFSVVEGQPVQIIAPTLTLPLPVIDLRNLPEAERDAEAQRLAIEEARRPFDLGRGSLLRATLLRLEDEEHVLLLTMHHIVSDGWSMGVFFQELSALYKALSTGKPASLPELPIQYVDFAVWQRGWLQGETLETQLLYWREHLAGAPPLLTLPTDHPRPPLPTYQGAYRSLELPQALSKSLKTLSHQEGGTLFMTLLAAFKVLLYRYTGQEDVLVGTPIANRTRTELEGLIGFFVNTLVLRTDLSGNPTFRELLGRVHEVALGAYAHQDLPFEKLVEELQPERDMSFSPLFQVMFVFQNAPRQPLELPGLTVSRWRVDFGTSKFDLTLSIVEEGERLRATLEYNTNLFDAGTIERMVEHYERLLEGIVADPDRSISSLPLLTEGERHQLLVAWNDTQTGYPSNLCIHQCFEAQAERTPDAVAVAFENQQLTYRELNQRANQLAHYLQSLGVGPDVLVGICVERSLEMVVGILGILKAGGAYLPLNPADPRERLGFMLEDAQAAALLTQECLVEKLPEYPGRILCLDTDWPAIAQASRDNPDSQVAADNLAYLIYTSGSTGRPKGVAVGHRSAVAFLEWAGRLFKEDLAGVLASTSICFDISVFELFAPLRCGGKIVLVRDILDMPAVDESRGVTLINTVPSAVAELVRVSELPVSVHTVNLAGEPFREGLAERVYRCGEVRKVFNLYGPTEDTVYSTFSLVPRGGKVTIGRPISNTQIYILDHGLNLAPVGVPGEVHIGGDGLARGYHNRPGLTAERFIPNPLSGEAGARLYKTGDLARWLPDGSIEFLGRLDYQVKIRGFRIELGEIEAVLGQHPAVRETVVVAEEATPDDPSTSLRISKRLVAYVVPDQELIPTIEELRRFLREKLPEYMVPSAFVMLEALPLTSSGKVDRRSLPAPDQGRPAQERTYVGPRNTLEFRLVQIWERVLGIHPVGVHDNFFDLGGHSLLAVRLFAEIEKEAGKHLPLATLFQAPTASQLADVLRLEGSPGLWSPVVPIQPEGSNPPFFCVHAFEGDVLCFADLAHHLGPEQPFYGLQARGLDGLHRPLTRIEDMAALYVKEIRTVQPEGPYFLGGYCGGTMIAFEMAQQLHAQGQTVALLALIQAGSPRLTPRTPPSTARARAHLDVIGLPGLKRKLFHVRRQARAFARQVIGKIGHKVRRSKTGRMAQWQAEGVLPAVDERRHELDADVAPSVPQTLQVYRQIRRAIATVIARALMEYLPQVYRGKIALFTAEATGGMSRDFRRGWAKLTTGELEDYVVPGNHMTMMRKPHVQTLAAKLRDCLLRTQEAEGGRCGIT